MSRKTPYIPEEWASGEVITQEKLQNIESGITSVDDNLRDLILVDKNNPLNQHPDNLLWFESNTQAIEVLTQEDLNDIKDDIANIDNNVKDLILMCEDNPRAQHPNNLLWFESDAQAIEVLTTEDLDNLNTLTINEVVEGIDLNNLTETGFYFINENTNYINLPSNSLDSVYGFLTVKNFNNIICQTIEAPNNIYIRFYQNEQWSEWINK